jgi:hypothetical protein
VKEWKKGSMVGIVVFMQVGTFYAGVLNASGLYCVVFNQSKNILNRPYNHVFS